MGEDVSEKPVKEPREIVDPGFPRKLLGGYAHFRKNRLTRERERYEQLAEKGQKPDTMIIACCDSRSAPETIFGAALAQVVVETDRLGLDIGSLTSLEKYERWRRFDTVQMGVVTDVLNRLFSNDIGPLRLIRTIGLGLVDRLPGLKSTFINQAAGRNRNNPSLLNGEAI